jgi:hypothetical protein
VHSRLAVVFGSMVGAAVACQPAPPKRSPPPISAQREPGADASASALVEAAAAPLAPPKYDDEWCLSKDDAGGWRPNDRLIAPFTISAAGATSHLLHSRYARDARAQFPGIKAVDAILLTCPDPSRCIPGHPGPPGDEEGASRACFYALRLSYFDPGLKVVGGSGHGYFSAGEYVDAVTNEVWFDAFWRTDAGPWQSEPAR